MFVVVALGASQVQAGFAAAVLGVSRARAVFREQVGFRGVVPEFPERGAFRGYRVRGAAHSLVGRVRAWQVGSRVDLAAGDHR